MIAPRRCHSPKLRSRAALARLLLFRWQLLLETFFSSANAFLVGVIVRSTKLHRIGLLIKPNDASLYGTGVPLTLSWSKLFLLLTIASSLLHHFQSSFVCGINVYRNTTAQREKITSSQNDEERNMAAVAPGSQVPVSKKANSVSYELFAPRSTAQVSRLVSQHNKTNAALMLMLDDGPGRDFSRCTWLCGSWLPVLS
jgi:hypothetical protein